MRNVFAEQLTLACHGVGLGKAIHGKGSLPHTRQRAKRKVLRRPAERVWHAAHTQGVHICVGHKHATRCGDLDVVVRVVRVAAAIDIYYQATE